ncbi:hypothetical protein [Paraburkholderia sp.]|uniref:hypothetical protein n=1 Tax=Paraburkholderia sp. TaxID=1926495 RepID=UPI0039E4ADEC
MRVRTVVAAALAVWCVSEAAWAAGYAEVWNPPEASGHVAKPARKKPAAVKVKTGAATRGAVKAGSGAHAKPIASVRHEASHAAPGGAAHRSRLAAHGGGAKQVASHGSVKSGLKGSMRTAVAGKTHTHGAVTAQAAKPHMQAHTQLAHAKPAQGKVMRANFAPGHTARPHVLKAVAKPAVSRPTVSSAPVTPAAPTSPAESATVSNIVPMGAPANPATARSGSLPPIIH